MVKTLADPLDQQQRSALVIRHVLTLEAIAGAQMMERAICILEIGISLAEREVQRDPLLVGQIVLAGPQLFQLRQAGIAIGERLERRVVELDADIVGRDPDRLFVAARRFVEMSRDGERRGETIESGRIARLDGQRGPVAYGGPVAVVLGLQRVAQIALRQDIVRLEPDRHLVLLDQLLRAGPAIAGHWRNCCELRPTVGTKLIERS